MLEPQAENPKILLDFHRRQAALNREAGDLEAAEWHGRQAQRALKQVQELDLKESVERGRVSKERGHIALKEREETPLLGVI